MFGYRASTKADEVVKLAKLYKKTKKYLTMEDVKELIKVVYEENSYLSTLSAIMNPQKDKKAEKTPKE